MKKHLRVRWEVNERWTKFCARVPGYVAHVWCEDVGCEWYWTVTAANGEAVASGVSIMGAKRAAEGTLHRIWHDGEAARRADAKRLRRERRKPQLPKVVHQDGKTFYCYPNGLVLDAGPYTYEERNEFRRRAANVVAFVRRGPS